MLLAGLVFITVFLIAVLLMFASGTAAPERTKQTLARLHAVLAAEGAGKPDELIDVRKKELLSTVPFINQLLLKLEAATKLHAVLYQADVKMTPEGLMLISLIVWAICTYLIYLRTDVLILSAIIALTPGSVPLAYVLQKRAKRFQAFEEGLPGAIDLMVNALRGGHSLVSAIELVGKEVADPVGREFRICFDEQNYGLELRMAMENLSIRMPIQDVRIMMTAIIIQKESGGNVAEVLDKCAYVIRERFRLKREIRVKTAQGRLTGWILSFLPLVLGILLFLANPKNTSLLWRTPMGLRMLYTGTLLTFVGALIIRRIVNIRV